MAATNRPLLILASYSRGHTKQIKLVEPLELHPSEIHRFY